MTGFPAACPRRRCRRSAGPLRAEASGSAHPGRPGAGRGGAARADRRRRPRPLRYDDADPDLIRLANPLAEQHSTAAGALPVDAGRAGGERPPASHGSVAVRGRQDVPMGGSGPSWAGERRQRRWEAWHATIGLSGQRPANPGRTEPDDGDPEGLDRRPARRARCAGVGVPTSRWGRCPIRTCTWAVPPGSWMPPRDYGSLGEVHPRVAEAWGLPGRLVIAAINLRAPSLAPQDVDRAAGPAAQPVDRDLAVSVDESTGWASRRSYRERRAIAGRGTAVRRVSRPAGRRGDGCSYAIALRFQPEKAGDEKAVEQRHEQAARCAAAPPGGPDPLNEGPGRRPCVAPRVTATGGPRRPRPCGTRQQEDAVEFISQLRPIDLFVVLCLAGGVFAGFTQGINRTPC